MQDLREIDLDKQKKHDRDVVDRLVVRDLRGRLTDSVETALRRPRTSSWTWRKEDLLFSRHLACTSCGVSVTELQPRMFSFNSPYGACPDCGGLGVRKSFHKSLILVDETKAIRDGALAWGDANWYQVLHSSLYRAFKLDPKTPYRELPVPFKKVLWEGGGAREFDFRWKGTKTSYEWKRTWEGILPLLERRYRETDSEAAAEMENSWRSTPARGARLKPEPAVTIGEASRSTPRCRSPRRSALRRSRRARRRSRSRSSRRSASAGLPRTSGAAT